MIELEREGWVVHKFEEWRQNDHGTAETPSPEADPKGEDEGDEDVRRALEEVREAFTPLAERSIDEHGDQMFGSPQDVENLGDHDASLAALCHVQQGFDYGGSIKGPPSATYEFSGGPPPVGHPGLSFRERIVRRHKMQDALAAGLDLDAVERWCDHCDERESDIVRDGRLGVCLKNQDESLPGHAHVFKFRL